MLNMEQMKELANDPVKGEKFLKSIFEEIDKDNLGYITPEQLKANAEEKIKKAVAAGQKLPPEPPKEKKEEMMKILDPSGSKKIKYEDFKNLAKHLHEEAKKAGKI